MAECGDEACGDLCMYTAFYLNELRCAIVGIRMGALSQVFLALAILGGMLNIVSQLGFAKFASALVSLFFV